MRLAAYALTRRTGPTIHCSRSIAWIDWFMIAPPPSHRHVPRHPPSA
jgi:hypothetical protein